MNNVNKILLVYDKQCPACRYYSTILKIKRSYGEFELVNAREHSDIMNAITNKGFDIDQGMVLIMNEKYFYGADALHMLAILSSRSTIMNSINHWAFKSKLLARLLYPLLRFFRNVLLKITRKTKINNLNFKNNQKF